MSDPSSIYNDGYGYDDDDVHKYTSYETSLTHDSGFASTTPSDAEKDRRIAEHLGEASWKSHVSQASIQSLDEGYEGSIPASEHKSIQKLPVTNEEKESTTESQLTNEDLLYAPYIPVPQSGLSSLHQAILDEEIENTIDLISNCPEPACLDCFTKGIHTSLHLAVYRDLPQIVRFLIVYGANFNATDRRGNTPLHTACELGHLSCIRMIMSPLEENEVIGVQKTNIPQDVNQKNYEGLTPLHLATIHNHPNVVEFLVQQQDINLNIGDSTCGRTAVHHALERRHKQCFLNLLKGSVNVNATTFDRCSPLHIAVGLELEQETRFLMTKGADVQIATNEDVRAYDLARTQRIRDALHYQKLAKKR